MLIFITSQTFKLDASLCLKWIISTHPVGRIRCTECPLGYAGEPLEGAGYEIARNTRQVYHTLKFFISSNFKKVFKRCQIAYIRNERNFVPVYGSYLLLAPNLRNLCNISWLYMYLFFFVFFEGYAFLGCPSVVVLF